MQNTLLNQTKESLQLSPKFEVSACGVGEFSVGHNNSNNRTMKGNNGYLVTMGAPSPRSRPACTCSNRPGSVRCARHGYVVPSERMKKRVASKEILRRALTPPPPRRLGLRWLNFRPTPSRLSNMSMA
ncbi:hypothetical protein HN51_019877 [Arachis hypogaea]|uniref:Uncharacterized protein LOC107462555 n=1 Tax=Arachis duranensis TaxID=130453 RepID=A0A6P4BAZ4_ARADU|nr:uncharacterized protein LOC107462555 [Arachis duranensis]XP_057727211.1 uncharacterized protein LOC130943381 [Arachis stenosperma]QHO31706.1 uncharacterized protein DS421_8g243880 [Arachis hypogaea]